ncbi:MAG: hypothetical protein AAGA48_02055 [Myxococcota bacterium]
MSYSKALNHPLWVGGLVLLIANDHFFKGAGFLPGVVTGKLSDVAGLIVAPTLLAMLLGPQRVRRAFAHLAVGLMFAALQVVPAFAQLWDAALASVGIPFTTVSDPTDLIALPALALSWWALTPSVDAPVRPMRLGLLQGTGLLACIATSPRDREPRGPFVTEVELQYQVALLNDTDAVQNVLVRQLRGDVVVDCDALDGLTPGSVLVSEVFDTAVLWELEPNRAIAALENVEERTCHAVLVDGPNVEPHVLYWRSRNPIFNVPIAGDPEVVSLSTFDDQGRGLISVWAPELDGECPSPSALDRLDWAVPERAKFTVLEVVPGLDGCLAVETDLLSDSTLYVCMPQELFPFTTGDDVALDASSVQLSLTSDTYQLDLIHMTERTSLLNFTIEPVNVEGCGWRVEPECGHVTADAGIRLQTLDDGSAVVRAGELYEMSSSDDRTIAMLVTRGEQRAVSVVDCGRFTDRFDVDVAVLTREP